MVWSEKNYVCRVDYEKTGLLGNDDKEVYRDCYENMAIFSNDDNPIVIGNEEISGEFLNIGVDPEINSMCFLNEAKKCVQVIESEAELSGWICFMNDNKSNYFCEYLDQGKTFLEIESIEIEEKKKN